MSSSAPTMILRSANAPPVIDGKPCSALRGRVDSQNTPGSSASASITSAGGVNDAPSTSSGSLSLSRPTGSPSVGAPFDAPRLSIRMKRTVERQKRDSAQLADNCVARGFANGGGSSPSSAEQKRSSPAPVGSQRWRWDAARSPGVGLERSPPRGGPSPTRAMGVVGANDFRPSPRTRRQANSAFARCAQPKVSSSMPSRDMGKRCVYAAPPAVPLSLEAGAHLTSQVAPQVQIPAHLDSIVEDRTALLDSSQLLESLAGALRAMEDSVRCLSDRGGALPATTLAAKHDLMRFSDQATTSVGSTSGSAPCSTDCCNVGSLFTSGSVQVVSPRSRTAMASSSPPPCAVFGEVFTHISSTGQRSEISTPIEPTQRVDRAPLTAYRRGSSRPRSRGTSRPGSGTVSPQPPAPMAGRRPASGTTTPSRRAGYFQAGGSVPHSMATSTATPPRAPPKAPLDVAFCTVGEQRPFCSDLEEKSAVFGGILGVSPRFRTGLLEEKSAVFGGILGLGLDGADLGAIGHHVDNEEDEDNVEGMLDYNP